MSKRGLALGLIVAVLILGTAAFGIYASVFMRMVRVPTGAMLNTIVPGDRLVVHRSFGTINRGDIVVFQYPGDSAYYVARIVGLPGETIQVQGKLVLVNGRALDEQRVLVESEGSPNEAMKEISSDGSGPYRVFYVRHAVEKDDISEDASKDEAGEFAVSSPLQLPNDSYFVLGDNRDNSYDSRYQGVVPHNLIWGKPSMIYYSESPSPAREFRWDRMFKKLQ